MSRQRRTADDFVRDMKAKQQQHSAPGDIDGKISEGLTPEQVGAWRCPKQHRSRPIIVKLPERVAKA